MSIEIPIAEVIVEDNIRKAIDDKTISDMAESITQVGVINPITVMDNGNGSYTVIAGHIRLLATKLAGKELIPAVIISNDVSRVQIQLIENIQRKNLSPLDEADAYQKLIDENGCKQDDIVSMVGKSQEYISHSLRLLTLPEEVKDLLTKGSIKRGHAKVIAPLESPEKKVELANMVVKRKLSVRALEDLCTKERERQATTDNPEPAQTGHTFSKAKFNRFVGSINKFTESIKPEELGSIEADQKQKMIDNLKALLEVLEGKGEEQPTEATTTEVAQTEVA